MAKILARLDPGSHCRHEIFDTPREDTAAIRFRKDNSIEALTDSARVHVERCDEAKMLNAVAVDLGVEPRPALCLGVCSV
jgi:hypothetical protein